MLHTYFSIRQPLNSVSNDDRYLRSLREYAVITRFMSIILSPEPSDNCDEENIDG